MEKIVDLSDLSTTQIKGSRKNVWEVSLTLLQNSQTSTNESQDPKTLSALKSTKTLKPLFACRFPKRNGIHLGVVGDSGQTIIKRRRSNYSSENRPSISIGDSICQKQGRVRRPSQPLRPVKPPRQRPPTSPKCEVTRSFTHSSYEKPVVVEFSGYTMELPPIRLARLDIQRLCSSNGPRLKL